MAHSTSNEVTVRPTLLAQADAAIEQICSIAAVHFGRKWLIASKYGPEPWMSVSGAKQTLFDTALNASAAKTPNQTGDTSPGENHKI
jgi:hypothetical protein